MVYANVFDDVIQAIEDGLYSIINNPSVVLLNIIAFLVLVLIIKKFFWAKITLFLEKRQTVMMEALEQAETEKKRAHELQVQSQKDYEMMKAETQEIRDKLMAEAHKEQESLIQNAKKEAKRRLEQAEKDIEFEINKANEDIKQSIKEVAFAAAQKIVKREIDETVHQDIIDEILGEQDK
ncbi:F0F1 ATP synthase subunit B [Peloplasma aerotolerans]|uniref:ATP synthase subunit b n=1 Tax=Peloplasma aerotolerans TaxID=3044389 RepID=A0AAW6UCX1_9MOLU|nr:F0F1 ATP synthase subunit B [Mariniplasma sp. M4Ah]MDI6453489.1 F0F1 ATP synthase subunit B [Mariniplasma sp. M4Ah]MDR4968222.1 F0F1 ATP synthase subunit B [Acholeplasmataceae bacterium]